MNMNRKTIKETMAEYKGEIAAIDYKIAQIKTGRNWENNARYKHLECMRGDLCRQLYEAKLVAARDRGGS